MGLSITADSSHRLARIETTPAALAIAPGVLARLAARLGPLAIVDLETSGLSIEDGAEILEIGALLVDAGEERVTTLASLVKPRGAVPRPVKRLTGLEDADLAAAPPLDALRGELRGALLSRRIVAHNAAFERAFLAHFVDPAFAQLDFLDTLDLLALTHPDAPDLRLESFTRMLLGSEERHRALDDALDTARIVAAAGEGARAGAARFSVARGALERFAPDSPWLALLEKADTVLAPTPAPPHVAIGQSDEPAVPFDEEAIAAALADEPRGRRHFGRFHARAGQIELARRFAQNFEREELLLAEGGTGVGKSLAYLAAAIPFALEREDAAPVVISTRTKLLQDQLVEKDIPAAARMLGHPELRAISIKGRGNYACARRLAQVLAEGADPQMFPEDRLAFAVLEACARTRPHGEIASVPFALLRRYPALRDLLRRSVAARAEQCSREQCAKERDCPLGRRRAALAQAHLIVANHDLLLRWPPDYPAFAHAIADEAHELAGVVDEVLALSVSPDALLERFDDLFGRPPSPRRPRGEALLPPKERRPFDADSRAWRRDLYAELCALGRTLDEFAGEYGEVQLPLPEGPAAKAAAQIARHVADLLDGVADRVPELPEPAVQRAADDLREQAHALRTAFDEAPEHVAMFENVAPPFDGWRLAVRPVSPAREFHERFLSRMRSFAAVSASLFVRGDAFAATGELELEERGVERAQRISVPSPFNYQDHMRVVALRGGGDELVRQTSAVLALLARELGGRTLGLFTSLRRMNDVADELAGALRADGIEVIAPRRDADDPSALISRFANGGSVLLGARRFWQGIDIPGDALQAVVIEKLPFEVPTELRRRREQRLSERGVSPFERATMGKMLLHLKQMIGRLIRTEHDRGVVVIVEGRTERGYFGRLSEALPPGCSVRVARFAELPKILEEVGIGAAANAALSIASPPEASR
jgi:ATP-dependent DNA helicase DinG